MSDQEDDRQLQWSLTLTMDGATRDITISAPADDVSPQDLLPVIQVLDNDVVALATDAAARGGKSVSCAAGCGACCRQLVPISETEAHNLARVVAEMPRDRRREIQRRFDKALKTLRKHQLLERLQDAGAGSGEAEQDQLGVDYFRLGIPCPFLEDESCSIHPDRPLSCREFLVTSPAHNCADPGPDNIEAVPLPGYPSRVLYQFADGRGHSPRRWVPLTLALDWHSEHRDDPQPTRPGHLMMQDFLQTLGSSE